MFAKQTPGRAYNHNRIGAVFVPPDEHGDNLVAHVITNNPAYNSGIRNGDLLLKVAELTTTNSHTNAVQNINFWFHAATAGKQDRSHCKTRVQHVRHHRHVSANLRTTLCHIGFEPKINEFSNMTIHINPNDAEEYSERAWAYYRSNDFGRAAADWNETTRLDPKTATAFSTAVFVTTTIGKFDLGISNLTEFLRVDPANAGGYCGTWDGVKLQIRCRPWRR